MRILHIANVFFELELAGQLKQDFASMLQALPVGRQLQYLPFLYAAPEDGVLCSPAPKAGFPYFEGRAVAMEQVDGAWDAVEVWGWSPSVYTFLQQRGICFDAPAVDVVRKVNAKDWAFERSARLDGAQLIGSSSELGQWLRNVSYPAVLKTVYGVSGRGHRIYHAPGAGCEDFARKEWEAGRPLIGEPWVERSVDFSSQWELGRSGQAKLLAWTQLENDARGSYQASLVGGDEPPFWNEHVVAARKILQEAHSEGYFGHVGIDAFTYDEGRRLHPICELNARNTMAHVALKFRDKHFPGQTLRMSYGPAGEGLLPVGRSPRQLRFEQVL